MNPVLAEILDTGQVATPDGSTVPLNYNISAEEGATLQRLIRAVKPRVTLEIGFAYGVSTLFICEALAEVGGERHIVIDPLPDGRLEGDRALHGRTGRLPIADRIPRRVVAPGAATPGTGRAARRSRVD
jgi:hypothetical protein